jgi:hypothetical protein
VSGALRFVAVLEDFTELADALGANYKEARNAIIWVLAEDSLRRCTPVQYLPIGLGLCRILEMNFREHPFPEVW